MDVSKLTPMPWEVYETGTFPETNHFYGILSRGKPTGVVAKIEGFGDTMKADAEFIALARNAFDVMMRRGWYPLPCHGNNCWWVAKASLTKDNAGPFDGDLPSGKGCQTLYWPDPFTALVEADKWYKENVEGK